ncbi:DUF4350 domain-containing protein [Paractinoplanes durhamensis]|uniref:DUF4350 domain-containing protein n=1 Tax=Paractinoplanes durhamensis TaxID=113563 RepID=UPI0031DE7D6A
MILFALVTGTLVVHAIAQPDPEDADYLSPVSDAGIGGGTLAARLRGEGVVVERVTSTVDALTALWTGGGSTLLVTTPGLVDTSQLSTFGRLPTGTRVVLVAPTRAALDRSDWPIEVHGDRWTATTAEPGCTDPTAAAAGPAAVRDLSYGGDCYDGALLTVAYGGAVVTVAGAADPFRNDRIGEHGNATLAEGLLSQAGRVVWLDVHEREEPPPPSSEPTPPTTPQQTTATGEASPGDGRPADPTDGPQEQPEQAAESPPNPLGQAFPPAFWATVVLLAAALLALAVAAARRLGTPVAEPLPSRVPALETLLGHARLYQRARARGASLAILRTAARRRLAVHLGLPPGAGIADIAEAAGLEEDGVRDILGSAVVPENDDELIAMAAAVQNLEREITANSAAAIFEGEQS